MTIEQIEKASMIKWWPAIKHLDIPMPKTDILPLSEEEQIALINHKIGQKLANKISVTAHNIGFPLFIRTDQTSIKHSWTETCFVEKASDLLKHVHALQEHSELCGLMGLPVFGLVFRKFVPMKSEFKAFKGMPVNPEWRFFAENGEIQCHHFYWVKDAIRFYRGTDKPDNWEELLEKMMELPPDELVLLKSYAIELSVELTQKVGGAWSIDFCKAKDGTWYLIDCAPAELSWHPDHDPKPKKEIKGLIDYV